MRIAPAGRGQPAVSLLLPPSLRTQEARELLRALEAQPDERRTAGAGARKRRRRPLRCRLGSHRMRYVGFELGRWIERCERCDLTRVRSLDRVRP